MEFSKRNRLLIRGPFLSSGDPQESLIPVEQCKSYFFWDVNYEAPIVIRLPLRAVQILQTLCQICGLISGGSQKYYTMSELVFCLLCKDCSDKIVTLALPWF